MTTRKENTMSKRLTLNADKRSAIASVFQNFWENEDNPIMKKYYEAKENYDVIREATKGLVENIVRQHQPQEDVETIRAMNNKYGDSGGQLYHDNCFYFKHEISKIDHDGNEYNADDEVHIDFSLEPSRHHRRFGYAYYRDELKSKGIEPDFMYKWADERRNPKYYETETQADEYLGFKSSNDVSNADAKHHHTWDNEFKLWVIGSKYCHSRNFKVNETEFQTLEMFRTAQENLVNAHENIFKYVDEKMKKLRLGLKSYKYFDQAKELADKLNVPLNESILNESSSMALSIYSPENLASLLEDKVEMTREEKIAYFRKQQNQAIN
tara:strand:+ start:1121 stop:2095 length:975 start_codon:yes stop_codon:yes gene_type:complete